MRSFGFHAQVFYDLFLFLNVFIKSKYLFIIDEPTQAENVNIYMNGLIMSGLVFLNFLEPRQKCLADDTSFFLGGGGQQTF